MTPSSLRSAALAAEPQAVRPPRALMNEFAVSPRFRASDLAGATLERKVDVFEDQVQGWLLDHARALAGASSPQAQHAGFAILTLMLTYVEGIACFIRGESSDGRSPEFFQFGLERLFPELSVQNVELFCKDFYREVRCGLLHQAMTRGRVTITHAGGPAIQAILGADGSAVQIQLDPWTFLAAVSSHFDAYVAQLRDASQKDAREKFDRWFEQRAA